MTCALPGTGAMMLLRRVGSFVGLPRGRAAFRTAPTDLDLFVSISATRTRPAVDHILYVGPLSPASGAADLHAAVAHWAEQHPTRPVEITWAGTGDLAGLFEAQPSPGALTQHFVGSLDRVSLAAAFAGAGLLMVPLIDSGAPVIEALAAGLVVIGGRRVAAMRPIVGRSGLAWSYDERSRQGLLATLSAALDEPEGARDARRRAGRSLALGASAAEPSHAPRRRRRLVSSEVA